MKCKVVSLVNTLKSIKGYKTLSLHTVFKACTYISKTKTHHPLVVVFVVLVRPQVHPAKMQDK